MNGEERIGIIGYLTASHGFSGRIKEYPEDFVVDEIPQLPAAAEDGKYVIFMARIRNWETNALAMEMAKRLGISKKLITYAGTKDKTAVKTQYFCINSRNVNPAALSIPDVEIMGTFRTDSMLRLGDLLGNRFTIRISTDANRDMEINETASELIAKGGFPNFFGSQRFGSIRPITHRVGKLIIRGDFRAAAMEYIADPEIDHDEFRLDFLENGDAQRALEKFPRHLIYERIILNHIRNGVSCRDIFVEKLPRNLSMMFVHAYQSYLFNMMLSERLNSGKLLSTPEDGDVAYPVDTHFNASKSEEIKVTRFNASKVEHLIRENRVRITMPIFGYESRVSDGYEGDLERKILQKEEIDLNDFSVPAARELSSKGERRIIQSGFNDFTVKENTLAFTLGKGIYATSLLREIMKDGSVF